MSQVSNVLMTFSVVEEPDRITEVNQFFVNAGYERGLVSIEDESLPLGWYGGNKPFESEALIGAFNFLDAKGFLAHIRAVPWKESASVQVFVQGQADSRFRVYYL